MPSVEDSMMILPFLDTEYVTIPSLSLTSKVIDPSGDVIPVDPSVMHEEKITIANMDNIELIMSFNLMIMKISSF